MADLEGSHRIGTGCTRAVVKVVGSWIQVCGTAAEWVKLSTQGRGVKSGHQRSQLLGTIGAVDVDDWTGIQGRSLDRIRGFFSGSKHADHATANRRRNADATTANATGRT